MSESNPPSIIVQPRRGRLFAPALRSQDHGEQLCGTNSWGGRNVSGNSRTRKRGIPSGGSVPCPLLNPGTSVLYGSMVAMINPRRGCYAYAPPELTLMNIGMKQRARYYRLPFYQQPALSSYENSSAFKSVLWLGGSSSGSLGSYDRA